MSAASRWLFIGAAAALVTIAIVCRWTGAPSVLDRDVVHLIDPDSHYHAWRMRRAADRFPLLASQHDAMINHPEGYWLYWPPGFDYLGGALLRTGPG